MRNFRLSVVMFAGMLAMAALAPAPALASTIAFSCITSNNPTNCVTGVNQFTVEMTDVGGGQVDFKFLNSGSLAALITDVYFDDGSSNATLLSIASIASSSGVNFSQFASPTNLPGGNLASPLFVTTPGFSADANAIVSENAVNLGEFVTIRFNLLAGKTFADSAGAIASGDLRIGIHALGFADGGSESFVSVGSTTTTPVPEPASLPLVAAALIGWRLCRPRRQRVAPEIR